MSLEAHWRSIARKTPGYIVSSGGGGAEIIQSPLCAPHLIQALRRLDPDADSFTSKARGSAKKSENRSSRQYSTVYFTQFH